MSVPAPRLLRPVPPPVPRVNATDPTTIAGLVTSELCVPADAPIRRLLELFEQDPSIDSIAVIQAPGRVGLITRSRFFLQLGTRFGFSVFEKRPIGMLAEDGSVVQADVAPGDVVHLALQREPQRIYDDIIVMDGARFRGLVSMRSLMAHHKDLLAASLSELATLDERNRQLQELNRIQSEFMANMTHELRSPLNVILGVGRVLTGDPQTTPSQRRNLGVLMGRAHDLLAVVDNLLDLAKLEAKAMQPMLETVELEPFLDDVVAATEPLLQGRPIQLKVSYRALPKVIVTDALFLRRVLDNLLSNAAKFTEHGAITLAVHGDGDDLVVSVIDTGVGMRPEDVARLFRRFTQLESTKTKRRAGTGLGLAIVKGLVETLSGVLSVESQPGTGSIFAVHLPRLAAPR
jgi:signal transduction histidine kinase